MRTHRHFWLVMVAATAAACGPSGQDTAGQDTTRTDTGARVQTAARGRIVETAGRNVATPEAASPPTDPDVAGAEIWRNLDPTRKPARNVDHQFLRSMADNNEGMVEMAFLAIDRAGAAATENARRVHDTHVRLRTEMVDLARSSYEEVLVPVALPGHKQRMDSLHLAKTEEFDREFDQRGLDCHRAWVRRIDEMSPKLTSPELRAFATRLRAELQREIETFSRRLTSAR